MEEEHENKSDQGILPSDGVRGLMRLMEEQMGGVPITNIPVPQQRV